MTIKDLEVQVTVRSKCSKILWLENNQPNQIESARDTLNLIKIGWFESSKEDTSECTFPTLELEGAPVWAKISGMNLELNPVEAAHVGIWSFQVISKDFAELDKIAYQFVVNVSKDKRCDSLKTVLC